MSIQPRDIRTQGLIRCEWCSAPFATRGLYNRHRKTHTKPYRCEHCSVGFALRSDLNRHKTQHGGRVDTKFYCTWPDCISKGALRRDNLLKHIRNMHERKDATEHQDVPAEIMAVFKESLVQQKVATERLSFMKAVQSGFISIVNQWVQNGADIAERNDTGQTSLHIAALNEDLPMTQALLNAGIDVEAKDDNNMTALYYASKTGNEAICRNLIQYGAGASITERNKSGSTTLHDISSSGIESIARLLLDRVIELNADADTLDNNGKTALYRAVKNGHSAVVASLLAARPSSISIRNSPSAFRKSLERLELRVAVMQGHEAVVGLLLSAGYEPKYGTLEAAAKEGHKAIVEKLLAAGADVNAAAAGYYGRTALQAAAERGHMAVVEKLLAAGADVNADVNAAAAAAAASGSYGYTALQAAARGGHMAVVEKLLAAGADVNAAAGSYGNTALQAAARGGHMAVVEKLLAAGADVNANVNAAAAAAGSYRRTALREATLHGHTAIMNLLVEAGAII